MSEPVREPAPAGRRTRVAKALCVPVAVAALVSAAAPGWTWYRVRPGDTLSEIAVRTGSSSATIARANRLRGDVIYAGSVIRVPLARARRAPARRITWRYYRVQPGDTLIGLSARLRVPVVTLVRSNRLRSRNFLAAGRVIRYPARSARSAPRARVPRARIGYYSPAARAQVRRMIRLAARRYGVDPRLALAVAYQESGFNQRAISTAGAIGVMQVMPYTGRWLSEATGRRFNLYRVSDNITAGVIYLRFLTRRAPLPVAIAGYYQGLASVRSRGMYVDTRRYVRSVLSHRAWLR